MFNILKLKISLALSDVLKNIKECCVRVLLFCTSNASVRAFHLQVTTHSRLLSANDLQDVEASTSLKLSNILCLSLQQFHTEQQFCLSVRLVMRTQS